MNQKISKLVRLSLLSLAQTKHTRLLKTILRESYCYVQDDKAIGEDLEELLLYNREIIKEVLNTREHIPSKKENKVKRQVRGNRKRNLGQRRN